MKRSIAKRLADRKRRMKRRLQRTNQQKYRRAEQNAPPIINTDAQRYELAEKNRGCVDGGIPLMHRLASESGLVKAIDQRLHLLKIHVPYHESDHVLNLAFNALCGGTCLQDIELRRNDECFLDAIGADAIPDPTTAGDFCRRFDQTDIRTLMNAIDDARINVWKHRGDNPSSTRDDHDDFFDEAIIDMDGTFVITSGECKQGMDISYKGTWGYHPLLLTLAGTGEVLSIFNRSGNRPSEEGAAAEADRAIALCRRGGFRGVRLRGDTAFSQTEYLDAWDEDDVLFQFGYDVMPNLKELAENLPPSKWKKLQRPAAYNRKGPPRARPKRVKREVIRRREFEHLELKSEQVAEFDYQPTACDRKYRMIVVRKNISKEKGERRLLDEVRYLFYITNDRQATAAEIVFGCNDRCDQENLIAQLAGGVRALSAPVDNLTSNWAYMVMTSLAWTLKAWSALWLPVNGRWRVQQAAERQSLLRMEFKTFVNAMIKVPCQIVRGGRRVLLRFLNWNPYLPSFFRLAGVLRC